MELLQLAAEAKRASYALAVLGTSKKNEALCRMADALLVHTEEILAENRRDLKAAAAAGHGKAFLDRLTLTEARVREMADGLRHVAGLPDPVGGADSVTKRPNGLSIEKRRVPLGVVGIIFEARPNVTVDAIGLTLKSGNACILRGGKEALHTNLCLKHILADCAYQNGVPEGAIQLLEDTSRETAQKMMRLNGYMDVLIPRGGAGLIRSVVQNASVPVIETGAGVCHTYIDEAADLFMAVNIAENAKCSRPSVCNACETVLVHERVAEAFLPMLAERLAAYPVELRCCERARAILPQANAATEEDWTTEYDDYILSIKVVDSLDEAIAHINRCGTHHSETIVTESYSAAERFLDCVDAAAVYVNASTRFTDGGEFGFGAEIGISTQKLHARGPMGLHELTTVKYVIRGSGQIR